MKQGWMVLLACLTGCALEAQALPETVKFPSRDGTTLTGYVFEPAGAGPHPAVVMLHGRAGPYSTAAGGVYGAATLSQRHRAWGEFWAARGYVAVHVDSFGPRGYASGFPAHSYRTRPPAVSEQTVRPLDAYGALDYLRTRRDVQPERIGVQGWSNGAMTVLAAIAPNPPGLERPDTARGFRAAIAQYPGCSTPSKEADYRPYLPLLMLVAGNDEEVSPTVCERFARELQRRQAPLEFHVYEGASHAYDDPGARRQSQPANRAAYADTLQRAEAFFALHLRGEAR